MKFGISTIVLFISIISTAHADSAIPDKKVLCEGSSVVTMVAGNHIIASAPFRAVFSIEGNEVKMVEGDTTHFSTSYKANEELTRPNRPGYESKNGNLFFYKESGGFEILKVISITPTKMETTTGQCKKYVPNDVFK